jgi:hypothetical protein
MSHIGRSLSRAATQTAALVKRLSYRYTGYLTSIRVIEQTALATAYTVALHHPTLSAGRRRVAEARFCEALERRLGSPSAAAAAFRTARAGHLDDCESDEAKTAQMRWRLASGAAQQFALHGIGHDANVYFDLLVAD